MKINELSNYQFFSFQYHSLPLQPLSLRNLASFSDMSSGVKTIRLKRHAKHDQRPNR